MKVILMTDFNPESVQDLSTPYIQMHFDPETIGDLGLLLLSIPEGIELDESYTTRRCLAGDLDGEINRHLLLGYTLIRRTGETAYVRDEKHHETLKLVPYTESHIPYIAFTVQTATDFTEVKEAIMANYDLVSYRDPDSKEFDWFMFALESGQHIKIHCLEKPAPKE